MERLIDELLEEIFLRFPPDDPACLARAAAVCKSWRSLLRGPDFLRRYRAFHRTPPMLGFFHNEVEDRGTYLPFFVPTSAACSRRLFTPFNWYALDARHGRALFHTLNDGCDPMDLAVWDPITGGQWRLRTPSFGDGYWNATVLCAKGGCDHLDCHGGPFSVAYVATDAEGLRASAYSSVTNVWSEGTFVEHPDAYPVLRPCVLVGDIVYFICEESHVLKYDMGGQELAVIDAPLEFRNKSLWDAVLMVAEGGGLGFAGMQGSSMKLWSRQEDANGIGQWSQRRVIRIGALSTRHGPCALIGFAEGASVIFIRTNVGVFTIELKSRRIKKVSSDKSIDKAIPYMSFHALGRGMLHFTK